MRIALGSMSPHCCINFYSIFSFLCAGVCVCVRACLKPSATLTLKQYLIRNILINIFCKQKQSSDKLLYSHSFIETEGNGENKLLILSEMMSFEMQNDLKC